MGALAVRGNKDADTDAAKALSPADIPVPIKFKAENNREPAIAIRPIANRRVAATSNEFKAMARGYFHTGARSGPRRLD